MKRRTDPIAQAIAGTFADQLPDLAGSIRRARDMGAPKSEVVARVTQAATSDFIRSGLLTMIDEIWAEKKP